VGSGFVQAVPNRRKYRSNNETRTCGENDQKGRSGEFKWLDHIDRLDEVHPKSLTG
jgi:hypothetical protein